MRHPGVQVDNFFLAGKEDALEFGSADEEMLELLALQAAPRSSTRAHQQEQRAGRLGAMIETTLVGVAAVNARTGQPVSFNREADLIVEPPRMPGGNIA